MKSRTLQIVTGTLMLIMVFAISVLASSKNNTPNQPRVTIWPTQTAGWITPDPTESANIDGIFPSIIGCSGVIPPYDGPNWEWIRIGETKFEELLDYLETLPRTVTLRNIGWNEWIVTFRDQDSDTIQQEWQLCLADDFITTFKINDYASEREAYVWDTIANWGPPNAVARTWHSTTRALFWFDRGVALTVYVWPESEHIKYGLITEVTYFPYVDPDNYENVYPYNQTNIVLGSLPARPSVPIELDPLDYEAILATVTPGAITDVIGGK